MSEVLMNDKIKSEVNSESAASYTVNQITADTAIIDRAIEILKSRLKTADVFFKSATETKQFLQLKLAELEYEVFAVLFLNNQNGLIEYEEMFRGTIDSASVYPREVARRALELNAAAVIYAHNHPSGLLEPSVADRRITSKLNAALELLDIRSLDHILVAGDRTYSFAEHGLM